MPPTPVSIGSYKFHPHGDRAGTTVPRWKAQPTPRSQAPSIWALKVPKLERNDGAGTTSIDLPSVHSPPRIPLVNLILIVTRCPLECLIFLVHFDSVLRAGCFEVWIAGAANRE